MSALLKVERIGKRFGGVIALQDVSFEIAAAEIVAVIGENGAGKSTLMKILGGVLSPDGGPESGTIQVDGKKVKFANVSDSMAHGIGFVHQELNVLDNLDVAANVYLGREPLHGGPLKPLKIIDRALMRENTRKYLQQLGLTLSPDTSLGSLSIAEQQMIEIAKALSLNARLVIMDEPTSSLTLTETARLLKVARDLRGRGVSIVYISHRLGEITQIADRVVALRDGKNAGELVGEQITHDNMVRLMVGRDLERAARNVNPSGARVLGVENLRTRRYPLQSVSFEVMSGEIFGIAGLVGAGRSEVAEAIFGVTPSLGGTISLGQGAAFSPKSARDAIARGIYLVPEDRRKTGLILDWPIRDNIALPSSALNRNPLQLINTLRETQVADEQKQSLLIKTPNVANRAGNLSGGNQQKVVLGKWLALSPKVMIFDEPTRGIDVGAKGEIYKLMRALADSGVAVVMISSDMEEVLGHSDRIGVMCEGAMTGILNAATANEEAIMNLAVLHQSAAGPNEIVAT